MAVGSTGTKSVLLMCIGSTFNSIVYNAVGLFEEDTVVDLHNVAILITFVMLLPLFQYVGEWEGRRGMLNESHVDNYFLIGAKRDNQHMNCWVIKGWSSYRHSAIRRDIVINDVRSIGCF